MARTGLAERARRAGPRFATRRGVRGRVILVDDSAIVRQVLQARKSRVAAERERLGAAP